MAIGEPSTGCEFFIFQNMDGKRNLLHKYRSYHPKLSITIVCSHVLFFVGSFSLNIVPRCIFTVQFKDPNINFHDVIGKLNICVHD